MNHIVEATIADISCRQWPNCHCECCEDRRIIADEIERLRGLLGKTLRFVCEAYDGRDIEREVRAALGIVTHGDSIGTSVNPDQPNDATEVKP